MQSLSSGSRRRLGEFHQPVPGSRQPLPEFHQPLPESRQPLPGSLHQPLPGSLPGFLRLPQPTLRQLTLKSDSVSSSVLALSYERDFANFRARVCPPGHFISNCPTPFNSCPTVSIHLPAFINNSPAFPTRCSAFLSHCPGLCAGLCTYPS